MRKLLENRLNVLVENKKTKTKPWISERSKNKSVKLADHAYQSFQNSQLDRKYVAKMAMPPTQLRALASYSANLDSHGQKALYINAMHLFEACKSQDKIGHFHFNK